MKTEDCCEGVNVLKCNVVVLVGCKKIKSQVLTE